ncbi:alkaline phosphatase family protein [Chitinophaga polysaccharea]|uniref:alkaline phosphatase family protein n=1 Tax=Chitinophaga polysaccharea TaxID=1293035 RepID=UPI0011575F2E|nr:alkaline phosphatase family protein [Chitinophaga polysaccharea]
MKRIQQLCTTGILLLFTLTAVAQQVSKPRIVVGMMVDQMRWDYLYRYAARYGDGGFKRLLREGFACEQTYINYAPTVTACGHTSVYTGSSPAVHGIVDNDWYSRELQRSVYCTEDSTVTTANAAFWYDGKSGNFISSSYYMKALPEWAQRFNAQQLPVKYLAKGWETLYPITSYIQSDTDNKDYEKSFGHENAPVFPHAFTGREKNSIRSTPYGNTLTFAFAKAAIEGYGLGAGTETDFLAVSFSSPDAVGHQFGPNSIEEEDLYLRLDKDLEEFFIYLDKRFGKGNYLYFITADHGVSQSPGFLEEHRLPTGLLDADIVLKDINAAIAEQFGIEQGVVALSAYQLYLNRPAFAARKIPLQPVIELVIEKLKSAPGVADAVSLHDLGAAALHEPLRTVLVNGYNKQRGGDVILLMQAGWKDGGRSGATHGLWYPYDAHIPLVWMGWGIKPGKTYRTIGMTDIAPTVAALLNIQVPGGNIGHVVWELFKAAP